MDLPDEIDLRGQEGSGDLEYVGLAKKQADGTYVVLAFVPNLEGGRAMVRLSVTVRPVERQ